MGAATKKPAGLVVTMQLWACTALMRLLTEAADALGEGTGKRPETAELLSRVICPRPAHG